MNKSLSKILGMPGGRGQVVNQIVESIRKHGFHTNTGDTMIHFEFFDIVKTNERGHQIDRFSGRIPTIVIDVRPVFFPLKNDPGLSFLYWDLFFSMWEKDLRGDIEKGLDNIITGVMIREDIPKGPFEFGGKHITVRRIETNRITIPFPASLFHKMLKSIKNKEKSLETEVN